MENFFSRYKNPLVLMAILFVQVVALATQVKRPEGSGSAASGGTRLIRVWTVTAISPFERALVSTGSFVRRNFHNYIDLHDARQQNHQLQDEIAQLKLEQVRLQQDAEQAKRLPPCSASLNTMLASCCRHKSSAPAELSSPT